MCVYNVHVDSHDEKNEVNDFVLPSCCQLSTFAIKRIKPKRTSCASAKNRVLTATVATTTEAATISAPINERKNYCALFANALFTLFLAAVVVVVAVAALPRRRAN